VELVDTTDLKSVALSGVPVRLRQRAPLLSFSLKLINLSSKYLYSVYETIYAEAEYFKGENYMVLWMIGFLAEMNFKLSGLK
jgi:hypothetical protein